MRCLESGTPGLRPRRIAPAVRSLAISDPHGFLIRTAAEVEKEEKRARRPGIDRARSAEAESARALSEIRAAVNALPKDRREILGLHLEGLTYRQIAQQTALTKEAVLCDLVSAYSQLRLALDYPRRTARKRNRRHGGRRDLRPRRLAMAATAGKLPKWKK